MRVLAFISEDFYFLSHRKELLLGLRKHGFDVVLVTNLMSQASEALATNLPIIAVNLHRGSLSPLSVMVGALKYHRIIRRTSPGVLFAVALKPILAASLCRFLGDRQPILCAFAGLGTAFSGGSKGAALAIARWGMEKAFPILLKQRQSHCLFQNCDDEQLFLQKGWTVKQRSHVIRGAGVELGKFPPKQWRSDRPVEFLFAGRLLWDKGIGELVAACRRLREKAVQFKCRVAGLIDPTNRAAVPLAFIEEQHRAGLLEWLGPRRDLPELMMTADCFVFPSVYREGVPKVLLEASAAGLAMITTDMPGCREVVRSEYNGLIVPPGDPVKLADAMERCVRHREELRSWGANARREAELYYGVEQVVARHVEIFQSIAGQSGLAGRPVKDRLTAGSV